MLYNGTLNVSKGAVFGKLSKHIPIISHIANFHRISLVIPTYLVQRGRFCIRLFSIDVLKPIAIAESHLWKTANFFLTHNPEERRASRCLFNVYEKNTDTVQLRKFRFTLQYQSLHGQ